MSEGIKLSIAIVFLLASFGIFVMTERTKPKPTACPDRSATNERLVYSTYHSDGRLECTYIPHGTYGKSARRIML